MSTCSNGAEACQGDFETSENLQVATMFQICDNVTNVRQAHTHLKRALVARPACLPN
jgi:hypothetical protein